MADSERLNLYRRHLRDRPVRGLTDDELRVLIDLGRHCNLFADEWSTPLNSLAELANLEDTEREMTDNAASTPTKEASP